MKKQILLLTVLFSGHLGFAQIKAWKQRADFPGDGRSAASSFSFSDRGFIGAGYDGEDYRRSFYMYDPLLNTWLQTESIGGGVGEGMERNCAASFSIGETGYLATGQSGDPFLNDLWAYHRFSDTWTFKGYVAGGIDRRCGVGFAINDKGYVGLGQDASGYRNDVWEFDTVTGAWTQMADFIGTPRRLCASFVIGGLAYVGTGDDGAFTNDFYVYDPNLNIWNARADFPGSPRYGATGFAVNGYGYIACGYDTTFVNRSDFYEYEPISDSWLQMPDFPGGARANAVAFTVDTLAFLGMGYDTSFYYDIWLWGDTTEPKPIDTTIGVYDLPVDLQVNAFPNPANDYAYVSIPLSMQNNSTIRMFNMQGVEIRCPVVIQTNDADKFLAQIDVGALPAGTYVVFISDKIHACHSKIIVAN